MNFFNKYTKYNQADLWLTVAAIREEKKQTIQVEELQVATPAYQAVEVCQPKTIFRKAERFYSQDDALKLREVYDALEDLVNIKTFYGFNV